jgi:DNA-binding PadR family transcriptional regulator
MTMTHPPRLPPKEALILDLLADAGESYGLELVEASGGRLKRGTVYVTLGRLVEKGYLTSAQAEPVPGAIGLPRRLYRLTPLGRRAREAFRELGLKLAWEGAR